MKTLRILGIRGVPAVHGGFETFAEQLALYLVAHGWRVVVYCQIEGDGPMCEDIWQGAQRVNIPVKQIGAKGTVVFDWKATAHASHFHDLCLTLGYNTAVFCTMLQIKGVTNLINMDGLEWQREKWSFPERVWLWLNERLGCLLGNHLIADHPEIANHLATRVARKKITTIPYGANEIVSADISLLSKFGIEPHRFVTVIARPEPENSILDIVRAFSQHPRNMKLVILGRYEPEVNSFHAEVIMAASDEVIFPGAIYDKRIIEALRFYGRLYIHGHKVGGTNPSLVEALGAGSAVLAHDNYFNRWVVGDGAHYFADEAGCAAELDRLLVNDQEIDRMRTINTARFRANFTWENVLAQYEKLLFKWAQK